MVAMTALRAGGTAVEAVEAAIKVLEDREITNAGYGSNLSLDGTVECDATIVDEYGRSGAVGAASRKWSLEKAPFSPGCGSDGYWMTEGRLARL